jgi:hypothetical protein
MDKGSATFAEPIDKETRRTPTKKRFQKTGFIYIYHRFRNPKKKFLHSANELSKQIILYDKIKQGIGFMRRYCFRMPFSHAGYCRFFL